MNWSDWDVLHPTAFVRRLRRRLAKPLNYNSFIELYNHLTERRDTNRILTLCPLIVDLLRSRRRLREALLFQELLARAHIMSDDADGAFTTLQAMIVLDRGDATRAAVEELIDELIGTSDSFASSLDHRPVILERATRLLQELGSHEKIAILLIQAAGLYSRHGAYQAAYRTLSDVEDLAHELKSLPMLAKATQAVAATSGDEGDHAHCVSAANTAVEIFETLGETPPAALFNNLGVAQMRLEDYDAAEPNLRAALAASEAGSQLQHAIMVNLAACLRSSGDLMGAVDMMDKVRSLAKVDADMDPDQIIERELVAARIYTEQADFGKASHALDAATKALDRGLADILRLHHRRGFRERYVSRIEGLLRAMPDKGAVDTIVRPLLAVRGNALGDWLSLLNWIKRVEDAVPPEVSAPLRNTIKGLQGEGAPHLFGFLEKYDDAWSPTNFVGKYWDRLSRLVAPMTSHFGAAMQAAELDKQVAHVHARLADGHCIMACTYAGEGGLLWILHQDRFTRVTVPHEAMMAWKWAALRFSTGEIQRAEFVAALDAYLTIVAPLLTPAFNALDEAAALSIRYLQDFDQAPPLTSLVLRHEGLARSMAEGRFEPRIVCALQPGDEEEEVRGPIAAIVDDFDDLLLPRYEASALAHSSGLSTPLMIGAHVKDGLEAALAETEILVVSTHGMALNRYSDPTFAELGGPHQSHPVSINSLQTDVPGSKLRLVMLNACHAGAVSARNYQQHFRTSDAVSFPAFFLLGGRAVVSAGSWRTSDTVSFLVSSLVGQGLAQGLRPANALASAIGSVARMSRADALTHLEQIEAPVDREKAMRRLETAPAEGAFSHPYLAGALAIHGLL